MKSTCIPHIPVSKEQKKKIEYIHIHPIYDTTHTDNLNIIGYCFSMKLKGIDEVFWCETKSEIYEILNTH